VKLLDVGSLGLVATLVAGCAGPNPTGPNDSVQSSSDSSDPTRLIECRQVPEQICFDLALDMMRGPQPQYAEGIAIERVLVTCEAFPPCGADQDGSGGKVMILYANGWAWTQDWAIGSGI